MSRERKRGSKQTQFNASNTRVNPIRTHGFGVYKGRRVVWGVRVDENLLKQAKPVLKAKFGSDCRGVEAWLAGLVSITQGEQLLGVNPSNTVEIGKLVIERNLRSRRKLEVTEEVEVIETVVSCVVCGRPVYAMVTRKDDSRVGLCRVHFRKERPRLQSWGIVSEVST